MVCVWLTYVHICKLNCLEDHIDTFMQRGRFNFCRLDADFMTKKKYISAMIMAFFPTILGAESYNKIAHEFASVDQAFVPSQAGDLPAQLAFHCRFKDIAVIQKEALINLVELYFGKINGRVGALSDLTEIFLKELDAAGDRPKERCWARLVIVYDQYPEWWESVKKVATEAERSEFYDVERLISEKRHEMIK